MPREPKGQDPYVSIARKALISCLCWRWGPMALAACAGQFSNLRRSSTLRSSSQRRLQNLAAAAGRRELLASTALGAAMASTGGGSAPARATPETIPRTELAPGLSISQVIKGCWQLSGGHGGEPETNRTSGAAAVEDFQAFVDAGITTLDTADIYGPSEQLIGKYLATHTEVAPKVQVLTKFCCFGDSMRKAADLKFVEQSIDGSRQRLGMDRLDLVQFYWHDYGNKNYVQAAQHLAELQARGKILHVGVTNFDVPRLQEMLDAGVSIVSNQVQYSLLDRRPDLAMVPFCAEHNIKLLPYGTVAGGFLTERYLGVRPEDVKVNTYSKSKYASVIGQVGGWDWLQELLGVLAEVAAKHSVSIADVASKWVLYKPEVAGVIVGARNASHVVDHQRMCALSLDSEDLGKIQGVLDRGRQPTSDCYTWERGGRF